MNDVYRQIRQHIPSLRRYARSIARNPVAADDLVQESLLRALSKSHLYKPGTNLRAWLFTIMRNQYATDMRRRRRIDVPVDLHQVSAALSTRENQELGMVMKTIVLAFRKLPADQRWLIASVAFNGQSYKEAAKFCNLPVGTVKSRISRGRRQLRKDLEGHYRNETTTLSSIERHAYGKNGTELRPARD